MTWPAHASLPPPAPGRVVVTEQSSGGRLVVLEPANSGATEGELRVVGHWAPSARGGHAIRPGSWGRPTEVRLRRGHDGVARVITCDSFGAVIVLDPATGRYDWVDAGPTANPHAIEMLPDGSIVVAASTGGWIRRYDPRLRGAVLAELALPDAHGVWWDAQTERLWALGGTQLICVRVEPSGFVQIAGWRLPSPHGHDLGPVEDADRRLWVTTGTEVVQFAVDDGEFEPVPSISREDGAGVKSIEGGLESGVLIARPSPGMAHEWLADRIVARQGAARRVLRLSAQVYKARKWEEIV